MADAIVYRYMTVEIKTKELFPHQRYIVDNASRFNVICGGRRGGKSGIIEELVYNKGGGNVLEGKLVGVFGISRDTMYELWHELLATGWNAIKYKDNVSRRVEFMNGGVLEFWSLENVDISRGRKYHRSIVDEAAIHRRFGESWNNVMRAHLVDYRGDAYFLSTPKVIGDSFHSLYMNGMNGLKGWRSFRFPTSSNPLISLEELADAEMTLPPLVFRREFLAEFVGDSQDMWLYSFDIGRHSLHGGRSRVGYLPGFPVYVSVDFNNNPLECTIWQHGGIEGRAGSFIHCIDSMSMEGGKVQELGNRLRVKYSGVNMYLCGDASGKNEEVGRYQTLYQIMASAMGIPMRNVKLNTKNLSYSDSRLLCNVLFQNYPRIVIEVEELVRQIGVAMVDVDMRIPDILKKDRKRYKLDMFDSMRYYFQTFFLSYTKERYFSGIKGDLLKVKDMNQFSGTSSGSLFFNQI